MIKTKNNQLSQLLLRDELLTKIRNKFSEASEKYGRRYFNLDLLEERILIVKKFNTSIDEFIRAEYDFFNQAVAKAEAEINKQKERDTLHEKINALVAENDNRIRVYPDIFFDPRASVNLRYFCGAVTSFYGKFHLSLLRLFRGSLIWKTLDANFAELERYNVPDLRQTPIFLKQYADNLIRLSYSQQEENERQILQTGGMALFKIMVALQNFLQAQKKIDEFGQIADEAQKYCAGILEAFRIAGLVEHEYFRKLA